MAFDGFVISNLVYELNNTILNAKISKIAQPETDELLFTLKGSNGQYRLAMSASASLPFLYLTDANKPSPLTAPNFCMLLRKHIANGRIVEISQPHMERIINFKIEHLDEMGDLCQKTLIVELMGKRSNIIFCDANGRIIDSIKHVSAAMSSLREVLPGRTYCIPATQDDRLNPLEVTEDVKEHRYEPNIITRGREPVEFSCFRLTEYVGSDDAVEATNSTVATDSAGNAGFAGADANGSEYTMQHFSSISAVLEQYYASRNVYTRIRQKSVDLRRIVATALDRNRKKYQLQEKQLKDTEKRDRYKVYGELIHTYGYGLAEGAKELEALNYYTNEMIKIPLDPMLDAKANAQKYFDKYNKLKRTYEALTDLTAETRAEIEHLESIATSLDIALTEDDLVQIKEELIEYGYIRRKRTDKKTKSKSKPFHYRSSDGYDIYVGKNNYQNEELTFKFATGNDWWFHAKGMPGSHVIVKSGSDELPDRVFEEAGRLAGYYSKGRDNDKIEIDYLQKKNVKKPNGSAPGFVVYYTNYSLTIHPDISGLTLIE